MIRPGKVLLLLGGLVALVAAGALVIALAVWIGKPGVPGQTILEIDFERGIVAQLPDSPVARLTSSEAIPLRDVIETIERAEQDKRVIGLFARVGAGDYGMATTQELRDAVLAFRKAGKPAVAFAETFGEFGPGNRGYYLATAFDEVWLQPSGDIGLIGVEMWSPFIKGTLDKLGVVPRMDHRYEYKNAMNMFTETGMTPAHREAMQAIADGWFEQLVAGIADGRKLPEAEVRALINRGPFLGEEAVKARLVDGLGYRDEVVEKFKAKLTGKPSLVWLPAYLEAAGRPHERGKKIALIYGVGGVSRGRSAFDPLSQDQTMGADTVTAAFRAAVADKKVKAILFRVDSPGGSYVASDAIWREVVQGARGRQAGDRLDGGRRRLGRLLRRDGGRQDRGPARDDHRVDRRAGRQDAHRRALGEGRRDVGARSTRGTAPGCSRPARTSRPRSGSASRPGSTGSTSTSQARSPRGASCRSRRSRRSPRDGSGPAPTPGGSGWWTSWAGCARRWRWPAARPG